MSGAANSATIVAGGGGKAGGEYAPVLAATAVMVADDETTQETVRVVAPSDLPGGYKMSVRIDGRAELVIVPEGGVVRGQTFDAVLVKQGSGGDGLYRDGAIEVDTGGSMNDGAGGGIQMGSWHDGTCDWCKLYWLTACCPLISLGQVMTRMNLNPLGSPRSSAGVGASACKVLTVVTAVFYVWKLVSQLVLFSLAMASASSDGASSDPYGGGGTANDGAFVASYALLLRLSGVAMGLYIFFLVLRTRAHVRNRYRIREECCTGCEDCCCAWFCSLCAIVQMARHTGDFHTQRQAMFTETGLEDRNSFVA